MLVIQARDPLDTFTPSLESQNDPAVWETGVPDQVENNIPILINLNDPTQLPHQKQYLLRPEQRQDFNLSQNSFFTDYSDLPAYPVTPLYQQSERKITPMA